LLLSGEHFVWALCRLVTLPLVTVIVIPSQLPLPGDGVMMIVGILEGVVGDLRFPGRWCWLMTLLTGLTLQIMVIRICC